MRIRLCSGSFSQFRGKICHFYLRSFVLFFFLFHATFIFLSKSVKPIIGFRYIFDNAFFSGKSRNHCWKQATDAPSTAFIEKEPTLLFDNEPVTSFTEETSSDVMDRTH